MIFTVYLSNEFVSCRYEGFHLSICCVQRNIHLFIHLLRVQKRNHVRFASISSFASICALPMKRQYQASACAWPITAAFVFRCSFACRVLAIMLLPPPPLCQQVGRDLPHLVRPPRLGHSKAPPLLEVICIPVPPQASAEASVGEQSWSKRIPFPVFLHFGLDYGARIAPGS